MKKILKFYSSSCFPCKALTMRLANLDLKNVTLESVDAEEQSDLAEKYCIQSVPTLIFLNDENEVDRTTGMTEAVINKVKAFCE